MESHSLNHVSGKNNKDFDRYVRTCLDLRVEEIILEALREFRTPIRFSANSNHTYRFQRIRLKGQI